jgi:release factor glutamine methyltransferase
MEAPITIARALTWATSVLRDTSPTARLDAELLLAHALEIGRARLLAEHRQPLDHAAHERFSQSVARRAALEPVAYLIGAREFYGLDLYVDSRVLVPRPETELLVELALAHARAQAASAAALRIADICTGSGCIALALAAQLPAAQISATDLSADALDVARINCERHRLEGRVALLQGDLCAPLVGQFHLLVSNPPYTILSAIDAGVRQHEPHLALDGGPDGLSLYRRLLACAPAHLAPGGALLLEIGADQGAAVSALAQHSFPHAKIMVHRDLAGHERVVVVTDREPYDV